MRVQKFAVVAFAFLAGTSLASADQPLTKQDAVTMVKEAVATIKAVGPEKAYAEIDHGKFRKGSLYVIVQGFNGVTLAHATNPKLIGKDLSGAQDIDGRFFVRDMTALAKKGQPFWYAFKFVNPVTKKIEIKDSYCEPLNDTRVCAGLYRS